MRRPQVVPNVVAAVMLVAATASLSYGYYTALRWVVTVAALVTAYVCLKTDSPSWSMAGWLYVGIAILFNPVAPIGLDRSTWLPIDLAVAAALAAGTLARLPEPVPHRSREDVN